MKKTILTMAAAMAVAMGAMAQKTQTMKVKNDDGTIYNFSISKVEDVTFEELEYVDLGLPSGTLWATHNIGAESPEERGLSFAWGEVKPKDEYDWGNYRWCGGTDNSLIKYTVSGLYGASSCVTTDDILELLPEDDPATYCWGNDWQTPSVEQMVELMTECVVTATNINGVDVLKFRASGSLNSIIIPASGFWTRKLVEITPKYAYKAVVNITATKIFNSQVDRCIGGPIRPVRKK